MTSTSYLFSLLERAIADPGQNLIDFRCLKELLSKLIEKNASESIAVPDRNTHRSYRRIEASKTKHKSKLNEISIEKNEKNRIRESEPMNIKRIEYNLEMNRDEAKLKDGHRKLGEVDLSKNVLPVDAKNALNIQISDRESKNSPVRNSQSDDFQINDAENDEESSINSRNQNVTEIITEDEKFEDYQEKNQKQMQRSSGEEDIEVKHKSFSKESNESLNFHSKEFETEKEEKNNEDPNVKIDTSDDEFDDSESYFEIKKNLRSARPKTAKNQEKIFSRPIASDLNLNNSKFGADYVKFGKEMHEVKEEFEENIRELSKRIVELDEKIEEIIELQIKLPSNRNLYNSSMDLNIGPSVNNSYCSINKCDDRTEVNDPNESERKIDNEKNILNDISNRRLTVTNLLDSVKSEKAIEANSLSIKKISSIIDSILLKFQEFEGSDQSINRDHCLERISDQLSESEHKILKTVKENYISYGQINQNEFVKWSHLSEAFGKEFNQEVSLNCENTIESVKKFILEKIWPNIIKLATRGDKPLDSIKNSDFGNLDQFQILMNDKFDRFIEEANYKIEKIQLEVENSKESNFTRVNEEQEEETIKDKLLMSNILESMNDKLNEMENKMIKKVQDLGKLCKTDQSPVLADGGNGASSDNMSGILKSESFEVKELTEKVEELSNHITNQLLEEEASMERKKDELLSAFEKFKSEIMQNVGLKKEISYSEVSQFDKYNQEEGDTNDFSEKKDDDSVIKLSEKSFEDNRDEQEDLSKINSEIIELKKYIEIFSAKINTIIALKSDRSELVQDIKELSNRIECNKSDTLGTISLMQKQIEFLNNTEAKKCVETQFAVDLQKNDQIVEQYGSVNESDENKGLDKLLSQIQTKLDSKSDMKQLEELKKHIGDKMERLKSILEKKINIFSEEKNVLDKKSGEANDSALFKNPNIKYNCLACDRQFRKSISKNKVNLIPKCGNLNCKLSANNPQKYFGMQNSSLRMENCKLLRKCATNRRQSLNDLRLSNDISSLRIQKIAISPISSNKN